MITRAKLGALSILMASAMIQPFEALADEPVQLKYSQAEIEDKVASAHPVFSG